MLSLVPVVGCGPWVAAAIAAWEDLKEGPPSDKPEGPAEAAPSAGTTDTATEPLPQWPEKKGKELQFLQLNGYLRGRGYYWHNFNLGHFNDSSAGRTVLAAVFGNSDSDGRAPRFELHQAQSRDDLRCRRCAHLGYAAAL
jgi:hypothetical protein